MEVSPYAALLDDLAVEHAELDAIVSALPQAEWARATPAEGWNIADTILHLALTDHVAALAVADPAGFEAYRQERRRAASDAAPPPPGELLGLWRTNRARLLEALRAADARQRITWFGPPMSAMSHATARLMETWAHGQDIVDALAIARTPTVRLRHIAHLGVRTRGYSYAQHDLAVPESEVHVELAAPDASTWSWGAPELADQVRGPALDFCLVVVQRRHLDDTDLVCEGPHAREWMLIAQAFAGKSSGGRRPGQFRSPQ